MLYPIELQGPARAGLVQIGPNCRGSGPNPLMPLPLKVCPKSARGFGHGPNTPASFGWCLLQHGPHM